MTTKQQPKFVRPNIPTIYNLEVLVMPNGEILCVGQTIGWVSSRVEGGSNMSQYLTKKGEE